MMNTTLPSRCLIARTSLRGSTLLMGMAALAASVSAFGQQWVQETTTRFPVQAEYSNQCTVVDVDGDGDLDIVWANGQGYSSAGTALKPRFYINNGSGFFTDETDARAPGVTGWFRGVEAGDIDNDGDVDLILAQDFNKRPILLVNTGGGNFVDQSAARLPNLTLSSARAQFGDVDNDGDLDLIFCNSGTASRFGSGQPKLYLNDGTGVYTDVTASNLPAGNLSEQMDIFFFDCDNDLDLDIFVATRAGAGSPSKLWKNDGTGKFSNQTGLPNSSNAYSFDAGDIDGDGDLDLIGVNGGAENLWRNNGTGTVWTVISGNISPNSAIDDNDSRFIDIDNDGDLDLIIGSLGSIERLYVNNGAGVFTQNTTLFPAQSDATIDIKVADFNGDGRYDVITAQGESGNFQNRFYRNATGAVDTTAPRIIAVTQIVPAAQPEAHVVRTQIFDSMTSDRGFHDKGIFLNWKDNGGATQQVAMKWSGNNQWRGVMPARPRATSVEYWVTATDWANNVATGASKFFTEGGTPPVLGDLNNDGIVDGADLGSLLGEWGQTGGPADLNNDGVVDGADLGILLGAWTL